MLSRLCDVIFQFVRSLGKMGLAALLFLTLLFSSIQVQAQTAVKQYVDSQNGLTTAQGATGQDWAHAYRYLTDCLAAVGNNPQLPGFDIRVRGAADEIGLIYRPDESSANPNGSGSRTATFTLRSNLAIRGGYSSTQNDQGQDIRDHLKYKSVLDGDLSGLQGAPGNDVDVTNDVNGNLVFTN